MQTSSRDLPVSAMNLFKPLGKVKAGSQSIPPGCTPGENHSTRTEEIQKIDSNVKERLWTG